MTLRKGDLAMDALRAAIASTMRPPAGLALYVLIPFFYLRRGSIDQHLARRVQGASAEH